MRRFTSLITVAVAAIALVAVPTIQSAAAKPATPSHATATASVGRAGTARLQAAVRAAGVARATSVTRSRLDPSATRLPAAADGTVRVAVTGTPSTVHTAVRSAGGQALGSLGNQTSVVIAKSKLAALAAAPGVVSVAAAHLAYETAGPSEAVGTSGAGSWISSLSGSDGTGTKIAVVDAGFANLAAEVTAGHLAANQGDATHLVNKGCTPNTGGTQHGTAVAEIVHQMAPGAEIFLVCVADNIGFGMAEQAIVTYNTNNPSAKVSIATSSLGFAGDSRGDGSGDAASTAAAVQAARQSGILWIQSAGNSAQDHWSGTLTDADQDGNIDLHGGLPGDNFEDDLVAVLPGGGIDIALQWDQWPTSDADLTLVAFGQQCTEAEPACAPVPINPDPNNNPTPLVASHSNGTAPTLDIPVTNSTSFDQIWDVFVVTANGSFPKARYDLTYLGATDGPSANGCPGPDLTDCQTPAAAFSGSVTAPAYSPFALAVGAHDVSDGLSASVEPFSSEGPTIDGRVKPDITGYDGVSSWLPDFDTGFSGTSAAAPHVAGAAALVKSLHPSWDAAQVQNFLEQRAGSGAPANPPVNSTGFGLLTLGAPGTSALPADATYQTLATPVRILDTRTNTGGHPGALTSGGQVTIPVPLLPNDATAVAINLAGTQAQRTTFLSAFAGGTGWPHTSNLNLSTTDSTAAVFAIVSVNANKTITVRNDLGSVHVVIDELGFFRTTAVTGGRFTALASQQRVLDTRTSIGGHQFKLPPNGTVIVNAGLPADATAAIVNVTAADQTGGGFLAAAPTCSKATSTLNFGRYVRSNLATVRLSAGTFCISNNTNSTDVVVDVIGYLGTSGATYIALPSARRIMDTRYGYGPTVPGPIAANHADTIIGSGLGEVPDDATALLTGLAEASATSSGYLHEFPGPTRPPSELSSLNFSPGRIVPNAAVVGVLNHRFGVYNVAGNTNAVVDLFGYFH